MHITLQNDEDDDDDEDEDEDLPFRFVGWPGALSSSRSTLTERFFPARYLST